MRALATTAALLCLLPAAGAWAGKKKDPEPAEEAPAGPREVTAAGHLADAAGVRANVVGTLVRATPEGVDGATEGTAVKLDDGALVFLSKGAPAEAWAWMVDSKVRVQGALWTSGKEAVGWDVAWLADAEAPMPADGMPGMGF